MFFFIPHHKASPTSPTFVQSCSLYLLCTEFSDSWTQRPQPRWFTAMVIDIFLLFSLYLISGFVDLDSLCLTYGFRDLDLVVKIWCSLHMLLLDLISNVFGFCDYEIWMGMVDLIWDFLGLVVCVAMGVRHGLGFASTCLLWCYTPCGGYGGDCGNGCCMSCIGCGGGRGNG